MFVVFDLDDTLARTDHRAHLAGKDWDQFYQQCDKDGYYAEIVDTFKALRNAGHYIEIWTGRSEIVKDKTEEWCRNVLRFIPVIRMRPADYRGPNVQLKEQWLSQQPVPPALVFEDRPDVAEMYRKHGCTVALLCPKQEAEDVDQLFKKEFS